MDTVEFLSNIVSILATSPDFRTTLDNLSCLANSAFSDWCAIFAVENENSLRRLVPQEGVYPLNTDAPWGPGHVVRTGEAQWVTEISDEVLASFGFRLDQAEFQNSRQPSVCLSLPLVTRSRTIGSIVFLCGDSKADVAGNHFSLAQAVANAAAIALENAELYRKAEEANRLKDEFVAMVSHELRTPLTPILGCIHLLRTAQLSQSNFDRALEMIERNAQAQLQIVEDLLDASRIVAGRVHLIMKPVQLTPVLEAAVDSVRPAAEGKSIKIVTTFEGIEQPIEGDSQRLQQIVWHLLSNAVKFTPLEGRIELSVKADDDHVVIQVADNGIGISADALPHIFDRFRSTRDGDARLKSGLGLGLAIVRYLVELHSGTIEAASAGRGCGAVFTLRFPSSAGKAIAMKRGQVTN